MNRKTPLALALGLMFVATTQVVSAQTTDLGKIKVEAGTVESSTGLLIQEEQPKGRSTVTRAHMEAQAPTSHPFQSISLLPGVNTESSDPFGLFGGSLRVRGFSSDQMGFTIDGAPVNDSGNFAVYPQEYTDSENLQEVFVTQGATDLDAPHVGAVGGNIGLVSSMPADQFGGRVAQTFGSHALSRTFVRLDSGALTQSGTKFFISYSKSTADKWRGEGTADRDHVDAKIFQKIGKASSITAGIMYNKAENNFYRNITKAQYATEGRSYDNSTTWTGRLTPVNGTAQDESSLSGYYNLAWNPFENYLATVKVNLQIADNTKLDFEPYYWYGNGSGGFGLAQSESGFLRTALHGAANMDLNGDGDTLDRVLLWRTSFTETRRPGANIKLTHTMGNHRLTGGLWYERAHHRQTQPYSYVDASGKPVDLWSENPLLAPNGAEIQGRNWRTISTGTQVYVQDEMSLLNDALSLTFGVRRPEIDRDGTNFGSLNSTPGSANYYTVKKTYSETLPQFGARYRLDPAKSVFLNIAKNFRAPANFTLYESNVSPTNLKPETAWNLDLGYRYQTKELVASATAFYIDFSNRMANITGPDGLQRQYNAGDVTVKGLELEAGKTLGGGWSTYGSFSFTDSRQQSDFVSYVNGTAVAVPTKGRRFVDTPRFMAGAALRYDQGSWFGGVQAKHTGKRFATLTNDESISDYTTVDLNAGYRFGKTAFLQNAQVRLNIMNLFDHNALAIINSTQVTRNSVTQNGQTYNGATPNYTPLYERAFTVTLSANF